MPRPPRIHYPGAVYHVMARGVDGRETFTDDLDRQTFLATALRLKSETPFSILAYCLMDNHFHFAIKVESTPLSSIMQRLLTTYVLGFNSRHSRQGHLFQARYKSILCLDDIYFIALIRYIHMNPVRANIVSDPGEWPWSSHRQYAGKAAVPLAETTLFFEAVNEVQPRARDYERWSTDPDDDFKPWPEATPPSPLLRKRADDVKPIDALARSLFPADMAELRSGSRRHEIARKKSLIAQRAIRDGHSLVSIAAWMSCTPQGVHRLLHRKSE